MATAPPTGTTAPTAAASGDPYVDFLLKSVPAPAKAPPSRASLDPYVDYALKSTASAPAPTARAPGGPPVLPPVTPGTAPPIAAPPSAPPAAGGPTPHDARLMAGLIGADLAPLLATGGPAPAAAPAPSPRVLAQEVLGPQEIAPPPAGPWAPVPAGLRLGLPPELQQQPQQTAAAPHFSSRAEVLAAAKAHPGAFQPPQVAGMTVLPSPASALPGGLFPEGAASGGVGGAFQTTMAALTKPDDAANAYAASLAKDVHEHGPRALFSAAAHHRAGTAALSALADIGHATPPTAVRELFGAQAGKTARLPYDALATLDYALGLFAAPSNLVIGPLFETAGAPLRAAAGALTRPALEKAGAAIAARLPGLAELGSRVGAELGIGKAGALVRDVRRPFRNMLADQLQSAGQIAREVRDATVSLRKASPAFDAKEQAWAATHDGASRLQELVSRYLLDHGSALRQATAEGIDPNLVQQFGQRLEQHAEATLDTLAQNGAVTGPPQGGELFRPGSAKRNGFLAGYADRVFGRPVGTTLSHAVLGTAPEAGAHAIEDAARSSLTQQVALDPALSAPIAAGQPLNPGWIEIPNEARFGSLAGKQVAGPVGRFVLSTLAPQRLAGNPTELQSLGQQVVDKVLLPFVSARKKTILLGNPAGLLTSLGARMAAAEIAVRRAGVTLGVPKVLGNMLGDAGRELWTFARTGAQSADIAELNRYSPAFMNSFATMVGDAAKKSPAALAGTGGKIIRFGGHSRYLPPDLPQQLFSSGAAAHGYADQAVKLALYKALKPKVGPERAAQLVEAHLFDYSDQPALLEQLNRYGIWSFNAWPTKAAGLFLRTLAERPDLVARVPHTRAQLLQDVPGAAAAYQNLPAYQQGPLVFPIGGDRFANAGRLFPFTEGLGLLQGSQEPDSQQTTGDQLLSRSLFGSVLGNLLAGRDVRTGRPIAPPGAPPDLARAARLDALAEDAKTSLQRGVERIGRAQAGVTASPSRTGEAQTVGEAVSQSLGVPVARGEAPAARRTRMAALIDARATAASDFVDSLDNGYHAAANPYTAGAAKLTAETLRARLLAARGFLKRQTLAANNFDRQSRLTDAGKTKLERGYLYVRALADRLDALSP